MKKFFVCIMLLVLYCENIFAAEGKISDVIPERFGILTVTLNKEESGGNIDQKAILQSIGEQRKQNKIDYMQFIVYDYGKGKGDPAYAYGFVFKEEEENKFILAKPEHAKKVADRLGYEMSPKELWDIYKDNEFVADEDFKNKPIIIKTKLKEGLSKDVLGKPYLKIAVDEFGLFGLHIYIDKDDPSIRKLSRNKRVLLKIYPQKFVMDSVVAKGEVLGIYKQN